MTECSILFNGLSDNYIQSVSKFLPSDIKILSNNSETWSDLQQTPTAVILTLDGFIQAHKSFPGKPQYIVVGDDPDDELLATAYSLGLNYFVPANAPKSASGIITAIAGSHRPNATAQLDLKARLQLKAGKLLTAQSVARLGTFEIDIRTRLVNWSDGLCAIYGIQPNQNFTIDSWMLMIHHEDRDSIVEIIDNAIENLTDCTFTNRVIVSDGDVKILNSHAKLEFDDHGIPVALVGSSHDVTEYHDLLDALKISEDSLRQSEIRYRQAIELAQEGIWFLNKKNETVYVNEKVTGMLGYTSVEMSGKDIYHFLDHSNKTTVAKKVKLWLTGDHTPVEIALRSKAGNLVWVSLRSSISVDADGNAQGVLTMLSDISVQKDTEDQNQFKALLLNMVGQAVIATDMEGNITYWNKAAESMYGWKNSEVIGLNVIDIVPSNQTREEAAAIMDELRRGKSWRGEFVTQRRDGSLFPVFVTDAPVYNKEKKLVGIVGVSTDATEMRKLEARLEKVNRLARYGTWEVDVERNTLYWSNITKEIHKVGFDFVPDIQTAISFYKPGESRKLITQALNVALAEGTPWDLELELLTANGEYKWVRAMGETERKNGKTTKIYGSFQDIDTQKRAQLELDKLVREQDVILNGLGDAFFVLNRSFELTYVSKVAELFLQIDWKDAVGKNLWELFPEAKDSDFEVNYRRAMSESIPINFVASYAPLNSAYKVNVFPNEDGIAVFFKRV